MPTNANIFNSRVTSEALEAKFRQVFPSQGGAELPQDLFASGVIQPVVDFSSVAEGSVLSQNLQTAWDFATGHSTVSGSSSTIINNTGFWRVQVNWSGYSGASAETSSVSISDGLSSKVIWQLTHESVTANEDDQAISASFVVFLRSGDSLTAQTGNARFNLDIVYRQIADVNGTLVNPLGFTFS